MKKNRELKEVLDHNWDEYPSMYPKYKGIQLNRLITQIILRRAAILAVEQVNNKMNFRKTLWMIPNIQKLDRQTRITRNTSIGNIRKVRKSKKNNQAQTQWYFNNQKLDCRIGLLFSQMNYPGLPGKAPNQSNTKLRSRQPTSRRHWIVPLTQTNPQSQTTPYTNENYSSFLNVDLMIIITNRFSVLKEIQHQQIAGEAAYVHQEPKEIISTNENVRKVASSTDSIVSGQVRKAGTKPINSQTAPPIQLQGNPICEPKVGKKGGRAPVRVKHISSITSIIANWNQSEDQQR
ncbi:MAG: hypothetical protein EZS28_047770 [Streblomastix strix]|uniref:Uncharacterized protein n=1 Tax=Streblomastix strix TaxID=222440 RepID=A0A5J4TG23_9EUKA|nr:MAG: hypothetical protein EZS28_047770 [Streblomastix strix]